MNEEELHKLFHRIELDKSSDSCGFEFADSFNCTFDNIATCYDDRLKLYNLVKQLQNNWNELKKWLEEEKPTEDMNENFIMIRLSDLKAKMQEMEQVK